MTSAVVLTVLIIAGSMVSQIENHVLVLLANSLLDLCSLPRWCSLRHRLLRDEATNQRFDGLGAASGSRGSEGCDREERAIGENTNSHAHMYYNGSDIPL
jgi:hypothetical protein